MLTSLENFSRVREKYFSTLVNENCRLSIDHDDGDDQSDKAIVRRPRRAISVNTHTDCSDCAPDPSPQPHRHVLDSCSIPCQADREDGERVKWWIADSQQESTGPRPGRRSSSRPAVGMLLLGAAATDGSPHPSPLPAALPAGHESHV